MALYRVTDWNEYFENHKTRILKRMDWVPFPNKMDGDGYTELVDHPDGAEHFGVWCALLLVASKCNPRGTLCRSGADPALSGARAAHDGASLARITRLSLSSIEAAIPRLLKIGWLEESGADPALSGGNPAFRGADPALSGRRTEGNGTEGNSTDQKGTEVFPPAVEKTILQIAGGGFPVTAEELEAAWDLHQNYSRVHQEPKHLVFGKLFAMNGTFDATRFRDNHPLWCEYWARKGWNSFGSVTFLGWIEAGMPAPPPESEVKKKPHWSD